MKNIAYDKIETKEELKEWMDKYHNLWTKEHNKLVAIRRILDGDIPVFEEGDKEKVKEDE